MDNRDLDYEEWVAKKAICPYEKRITVYCPNHMCTNCRRNPRSLANKKFIKNHKK